MLVLMFSRARILFIVIVMLIGIIGCTHRYTPKQYPLKPGMAPEFSGGHPISLINVQESTDEVLICKTEFNEKLFGNLQEWTDSVIGLLRSELEKRDIVPTEDADKQLRISVTQAKVETTVFTIRCFIYLKVETGDGYEKEIEINSGSFAGIYERACDGAVTRAVAAILNDDTILAYLKL